MGRLRYPKATNLKDDRNVDVYHQVEHGLQAPHKVKTVISHWLPCGVDGRA